MPCLPSIAACALLAAMSSRNITRSTSIEELTSSRMASGLAANRPPHILLLMIRSRSKRPDRNRFYELRNRGTVLVIVIVAAAAIAAAVYGIAGFRRNAAGAACTGALQLAKRVAPLAHGEVAAFIVAEQPLLV